MKNRIIAGSIAALLSLGVVALGFIPEKEINPTQHVGEAYTGNIYRFAGAQAVPLPFATTCIGN